MDNGRGELPRGRAAPGLVRRIRIRWVVGEPRYAFSPPASSGWAGFAGPVRECIRSRVRPFAISRGRRRSGAARTRWTLGNRLSTCLCGPARAPSRGPPQMPEVRRRRWGEPLRADYRVAPLRWEWFRTGIQDSDPGMIYCYGGCGGIVEPPGSTPPARSRMRSSASSASSRFWSTACSAANAANRARSSGSAAPAAASTTSS